MTDIWNWLSDNSPAWVFPAMLLFYLVVVFVVEAGIMATSIEYRIRSGHCEKYSRDFAIHGTRSRTFVKYARYSALHKMKRWQRNAYLICIIFHLPTDWIWTDRQRYALGIRSKKPYRGLGFSSFLYERKPTKAVFKGMDLSMVIAIEVMRDYRI